MTLDIKDYYLGTPMARTEYMMVPLTDLPDATITKYDLHAKAECALFRHETRNISFVLVVDDFGVKYTSQEDADHLIATLTELYTIKVDWTGGVSYCGNTDDDTLINGPIKCISRILDCVVASAAETEYGSLFYNAREAAEQRNTLTDMGHPQETTLIVCDNSCAVGVANSTTRQRRSKAWDMRFHWIRDRVRQDQFDVVWRKGQVNLADYFTKDHPTKHFMAMRPFFVQTPARGLTDTARSRRIQNRVARQGARPPNGGHRRLTTADLPSPKAPRVTQSPRPTLS
eukprot:g20030.t1